ncbi:MAG: hypothetical protein QM778_01030 [Myxococcales bacterium]
MLPLTLLAAACLATACSEDTTPPRDGETLDGGDGDGGGGQHDTGTVNPGDGDGDGDGDGGQTVVDSGADSGADSGPCVPKGCDELPNIECGSTTDGCGGPLDCGDDKCTGVNTCGAVDANKCGCKPKTCEDLGAVCGEDIDDGCGGKIPTCGAGDCLAQGDNYICNQDRTACACVPESELSVCAQHACGDYGDGCGLELDINCGTCGGYKHCVDSGAASDCQCDTTNNTLKTQACAGKTCGTVTTADGCQFTCGAACGPTSCGLNGACTGNCTCPNDGNGAGEDQICVAGNCCTPPANAAAACGAQNCGEVTVCGTKFSCGNNNTTACADATKACSDPTYDKQHAKPTCIDKKQADLLGTYLVRSHAFRGSRDGNTDLVNRSESLSIVTIEVSAAGALRMRDYGCFTTGIDIKGANPSIAPSYYNLPELLVDLSVAAGSAGQPNTWLRPAKSIAAGYIDARPGNYFCDAAGAFTGAGNAATDFNTAPGFIGPTVTAESGARKVWLGNYDPPKDEQANQACTCPANLAAYSAMPAENVSSSASGVTDCRINDIDDDNKPGFSIIAKYGTTTLNVAAASLSTTEWWGNIDPAGRHYGFGAISASHARTVPLSRKFLTCGGSPAFSAGLLCLAAPSQSDWGCGAQYDVVRFEKQPKGVHYDTFDQLKNACIGAGKYYANAPATAVGQAKTKVGEFSFTTACTTSANCREDEICKAGKCWPMTSPEVCDTTTAPCRAGWVCADSDHSCWPATCTDPTP